MEKRRLWFFIILLISAFTAMTYQSIKGPIKPLYYLRYPINYIHEGANYLTESIATPLATLFSLAGENRDLKTEIRSLKVKEQQFNEALLENKRLKALLSLRPSIARYVTAAKVIARSPDKWSHSLILDKGTADGVHRNMVVRTADGILGKIVSSDLHHAKVIMLTDINSSLAVRLQKNRVEGILSGTGSFICSLKYIPNDEYVEKGDVLITSGFDRLYPPGIPVGKIISVDRTQEDLFQAIQVEPFSHPLKVEEVLIIEGYKRDIESENRQEVIPAPAEE